MRQAIKIKQQGMTLIELTVVLLILTSLATIALRSTTGLVEQTKWEQTQKRYKEIKKAIIGDPNLVINGEPDISGFVVDMGRLPKNIHELLKGEYCDNDFSIDNAISCTSASPPGNWIILNPEYCDNDYTILSDETVTTDSTICTSATPAGIWITNRLPAPPTSSPDQIGFGWKGPYLITSGNAEDKSAFTDGWSRKATDPDGSGTTDPHSYGWDFSVATAPAPISQDYLKLQSYGKDRSKDAPPPPEPAIYDKDFPENATAIDVTDWMVDIAGGIDVNIHSYTNQGICDVSTVTNGQACKDAGWVWPGGFKCVHPVTFVEVLNPAATPPIITDYTTCISLPATPPATVATANIWRWEPFACIASSAGALSSGACSTSPGGVWRSSNGYCTNLIGTDLTSCTTPIVTTPVTPPGIWIDGTCTYPSTVATPIVDKTSCLALTTTTPEKEEWAKCKVGSATPTHSKAFCENYGASWNDITDVCLNIKYKGLNIDANQPSIVKNTSAVKTIHSAANMTYKFSPFTTTHLPAGKAMFEVKHYVAGVCTDLTYPQSFCQGSITTLECTTASATNVWEQACYGVTENYCTVTAGGDFTAATPSICKNITPAQCTSATPTVGVLKNTCYGDGLDVITTGIPGNYCTNTSTADSVLVSSTLTIPPVVKNITPHRPIPTIVW